MASSSNVNALLIIIPLYAGFGLVIIILFLNRLRSRWVALHNLQGYSMPIGKSDMKREVYAHVHSKLEQSYDISSRTVPNPRTFKEYGWGNPWGKYAGMNFKKCIIAEMKVVEEFGDKLVPSLPRLNSESMKGYTLRVVEAICGGGVGSLVVSGGDSAPLTGLKSKLGAGNKGKEESCGSPIHETVALAKKIIEVYEVARFSSYELSEQNYLSFIQDLGTLLSDLRKLAREKYMML
eukprot:Nk52_evm26s1178 gene=Nk52_evmTU26s1178